MSQKQEGSSVFVFVLLVVIALFVADAVVCLNSTPVKKAESTTQKR